MYKLKRIMLKTNNNFKKINIWIFKLKYIIFLFLTKSRCFNTFVMLKLIFLGLFSYCVNLDLFVYFQKTLNFSFTTYRLTLNSFCISQVTEPNIFFYKYNYTLTKIFIYNCFCFIFMFFFYVK